MRYRHILFDLDGTLIQSEAGIFTSVAYAYEKLNRPCPSTDTLRKFIGPPLLYSFEHFGGLSAEESYRAVDLYREYYTEHGIFACEAYAGLESMLKQLHKSGASLYVATAKPEVFAVRILKHLQLHAYFTQIVGSSLEVGHPKKQELIGRILTGSNLPLQRCVMVGDRHFDIEGAHAHSIDSIGVLYGYGDEEELTQAGATHIAKDVKTLSAFLLGQTVSI